MAVLFRWLLRIASGLILLGVAVVLIAYLFATRSLPDYNEDFTLEGPVAPIEIVRDNAAVPHIFGQSDHDSYFGLGFVHAQDRFWQMMMLRRTVQGRLSEIFGPSTLKIDELMRRYDLYGLATASVTAQDAATLAALQAYADGVNAWIRQVGEGARGRGAPEMWLFNAPIAPWQPADSLAVLKLMALQLSGQIPTEVLRARVSLQLDNARVADILPDDPGAAIAALPEYIALVPGVERYAQGQHIPFGPLNPVQPRGKAGASNAWAAAPARAAAGASLLANDPHLDLSAPSVWYLARLDLQSGAVIGGTIPGIPAVLLGRSADLGWALTSSYLDDQDVFIEEVNPQNPDEYRTPEGWKPFVARDSVITVKGEAPVTIRLQWTDNGPVLPPDLFDLGTIRPPGHVTSVAWTALSGADSSMTAALRIMRSLSVTEAIAAGALFVAPSQNLTLADRNTIAMKMIGAAPRRDPASQARGRMPSFGYLPQNRWQGSLPYASNAEFLQPVGGIVGNTNNKFIERDFPMHVTYDWGDSQRVHRWERLMQLRGLHTRESFMEAQLDTVSFTARALLPLVGADLWFTGEAAPAGSIEARRQQALEMLADWNGEMNEHMPEPLIYAAWMRALQERLIRDDLGPLTDEFTQVEPLFIERVFRNVDGAGAWCDVIQSAADESCTDIAREALDDALVWIADHGGTALESLRWGEYHQAVQDHAVLGDLPGLSWFVNIRQSTSGGDNTLMRGLTSGTGDNPFENVHAAGYRGVYDFADPDSSVFVISTGQSGNPMSRHYDDLGELWRRGEYIPMSLDANLARAGAIGISVLSPLPAQ